MSKNSLLFIKLVIYIYMFMYMLISHAEVDDLLCNIFSFSFSMGGAP